MDSRRAQTSTLRPQKKKRNNIQTHAHLSALTHTPSLSPIHGCLGIPQTHTYTKPKKTQKIIHAHSLSFIHTGVQAFQWEARAGQIQIVFMTKAQPCLLASALNRGVCVCVRERACVRARACTSVSGILPLPLACCFRVSLSLVRSLSLSLSRSPAFSLPRSLAFSFACSLALSLPPPPLSLSLSL